MTNIEKETVILFNEAEGVAQIETFNPRLLRQLRKVAECDGVSCAADQSGYGCYTIPKSMIKIHGPRRGTLNESQRAKASERMKARSAERHKINFEC